MKLTTSVEWKPRTDEDVYEDGWVLLVACDVLGQWVFDIVVIYCDEDDFDVGTQDGEPWDGDFDEVRFYARIGQIGKSLDAAVKNAAEEKK